MWERSQAPARALIALLLLAGPAWAQDAKPGRVGVYILAPDGALAGRPAMVSAIYDGNVVDQQEILLSEAPNKAWVALEKLAPALHDVRVEGEGFITEVKRGIHIFPGRDTTLQFVVKPGQGVHIVEYAVGGLAREEVAARLGKLESAVGKLQGDVARIEKAGGAN